MKLFRSTLITAALALAVAGCGPGSGGTGSGEDSPYFAVFGARSANICTATIAGTLACPISVGVASAPADNPGSAMVNFSDVAQGGHISVAIQSNRIDLSERCRKLYFMGDWGITASDDARFFGSYTLDNMAAVPGSLSVQSGSGNQANELQVVVRDAEGRVVLGPVTLQRVAAPATPTLACPI